MIELPFTDEQRALAATARDLFDKESPPSRLRAIWEGADPGDQVWRKMADVGLLGILIAEDHGGLGGDETDLVLVLEEAGRAALPEPFAECAIAARALDHPVHRDTLPGIAAGEVLAVEQVGHFAPDADRAQIVLIGRVMHRSFEAVRVPSVDHGRRLFRVTPTHVGLPVDAQIWHGHWAMAAVLNGVSIRLLEMTIEHAKARHQFGVPIGSFQAVKHTLASCYALLSAARAASHGAAYAIARAIPQVSFAVRVAAQEARAAHAAINRAALQIHAGIGFTWEHDLHLYLKRGLALSGLLPSATLRPPGKEPTHA